MNVPESDLDAAREASKRLRRTVWECRAALKADGLWEPVRDAVRDVTDAVGKIWGAAQRAGAGATDEEIEDIRREVEGWSMH